MDSQSYPFLFNKNTKCFNNNFQLSIVNFPFINYQYIVFLSPKKYCEYNIYFLKNGNKWIKYYNCVTN